jgi:hypothetical protein
MAVSWNKDRALTPLVVENSQGRFYLYDLLGETVGVADCVQLATPGKVCSMVLLHVERQTAGGSTTLQPDVYTATGAPDNTVFHEGHQTAAVARVRDQSALTLQSQDGSIWIYPRPDAEVPAMRVRVILRAGVM